ncbi:hypothetical protein SCHPADRAFT_509648 [Schizopora paradoxa]|uniref:Uncharacterized protein n=1 Tax=Schizopora paradoxa TaxID=27342 RepID=A0A0H2S0N4_9AGAM|nr:hypothetical protein SCHPADRAFT_509648 [Schizopora paradoxa]
MNPSLQTTLSCVGIQKKGTKVSTLKPCTVYVAAQTVSSLGTSGHYIISRHRDFKSSGLLEISRKARSSCCTALRRRDANKQIMCSRFVGLNIQTNYIGNNITSNTGSVLPMPCAKASTSSHFLYGEVTLPCSFIHGALGSRLSVFLRSRSYL